MLRNYLVVAVRNLTRQKVYSTINIFGLAIGIAFCILTFLYVRHEWTFDAFHEHGSSIHRLYMGWKDPDGSRRYFAAQCLPLAPVLAENIPEITHTVRLMTSRGWITCEGEMFREDLLFADAALFDVFTFPLRLGDAGTALRDRDSAVLSEEMARKLFGGGDPMGRRISILRSGDRSYDFTVRGVVRRIPENSSIRFDCLLPYERLTDLIGVDIQSWNTNYGGHTAYVRLAEGARASEVEAKFPSVVERYMPDDDRQVFHLQRLADVHYATHVRHSLEPVSNPAYSYILAGIALLVLAIACINFTNLSIGRSMVRAREVGVRKVMGAGRRQVMVQFWGESLLLSLLALLLGVGLAELFLPAFSDLVQRRLAMAFHLDGWTPGVLVGLVFLVSLAAGGYPAVFLSRLHPVSVLKKTLRIGGKGLLGRTLVVVQYALSIFLIISTILMFRQVDFLKMRSLGAHGEQVLVIPLHGLDRAKVMEVFRNKLAQYEDITGVSGASHLLGKGVATFTTMYRGERLRLGVFEVDYDYLDFMGIELVSGRTFSKAFGVGGVIVNEALMRTIGSDAQRMKGLFRGRPIIGVVKDFHYKPLYHPIEPAMFSLTSAPSYLFVKIRPEGIPAALALLEDTWRWVVPNLPFDFAFLDAHVDGLYRSEARWSRIIGYSSLFAIFVASLGAFGLTALAVTRRTKEIGIRKALGASASSIVLLLSGDFARLVAVAGLIAWPVAYYAMDRWLQDFAYRIELGVGVFALGGVLALLVAVAAVGAQAIKAAVANPVDALRYE